MDYREIIGETIKLPGSELLIQLCYVSTAVRMMSRDELTDILQTSRRKNVQRNISGMLVYKDMSFLQVLEGEAGDVDELYETISADPRHHRLSQLFRIPITRREFGEWAMGFYHPQTDELEFVDGYSEFMNSGLIPRAMFWEQSRARGILQHFRKLG